jgi:hypothetical protein
VLHPRQHQPRWGQIKVELWGQFRLTEPDYPLPARFQAELYAVVTGLHGVRFDRSATDFAGRRGIGLYMIQTHLWKVEIILNPRTYTYMGLLVIATKTRTEYGHLVRKGQIQAWNAVLGSAIVQKAGQRP